MRTVTCLCSGVMCVAFCVVAANVEAFPACPGFYSGGTDCVAAGNSATTAAGAYTFYASGGGTGGLVSSTNLTPSAAIIGQANSGTSAIGVYGSGTEGFGVYGASASSNGVTGSTFAGYPAAGVYGTSTATSSDIGVLGYAQGTSSAGVEGHTNTGAGVVGWTDSGGKGVTGLSTSTTGYGVYGSNQGGSGYAIYANGAAGGTTGWNSGSDIRLKKDIEELPYGLDQILRLRSVTYKLKAGDDRRHVGFIAQDLEKVVPEVVSEMGDDKMLSVDYAALVPVLTRAAQDQQRVIEHQEARIATLERGRTPVLSYMVPGGVGGAALALIPFGLVLGIRRRHDKRD